MPLHGRTQCCHVDQLQGQHDSPGCIALFRLNNRSFHLEDQRKSVSLDDLLEDTVGGALYSSRGGRPQKLAELKGLKIVRS